MTSAAIVNGGFTVAGLVLLIAFIGRIVGRLFDRAADWDAGFDDVYSNPISDKEEDR